jgi:chorismate mutase/prephenate dehydratase
MTELNDIRIKIDMIDKELVALFERRLTLAKRAGDIKRRLNLPIQDKAREAEILLNRASMLTDATLAEPLGVFLITLLSLSRGEQHKANNMEAPYA